jgi:ribosomal protein L7/L12
MQAILLEGLKLNIYLIALSGILMVLLILEKVSNSKTALKRRIEQLENEILLLKRGENNELDGKIRNLLNENKDVKAVKLVRETLGFDLLQAKKYVDDIKANNDLHIG